MSLLILKRILSNLITCSLYPWGYDRKVPADHEELDRVGKEAAAAIRAVDGKDYTVGPAGSTVSVS